MRNASSTAHGRRRLRARKVASLLLLAVGWMALVATSQDPNDSSWAGMRFGVDALDHGQVLLMVAVNDAGVSLFRHVGSGHSVARSG